MKKRFFGLITVGVMTIFTFTACGEENSNTNVVEQNDVIQENKNDDISLKEETNATTNLYADYIGMESDINAYIKDDVLDLETYLDDCNIEDVWICLDDNLQYVQNYSIYYGDWSLKIGIEELDGEYCHIQLIDSKEIAECISDYSSGKIRCCYLGEEVCIPKSFALNSFPFLVSYIKNAPEDAPIPYGVEQAYLIKTDVDVFGE